MEQKEKERLFGEIAVDLDYLTHKDVEEALAQQQSHEGTPDRKAIGEYLREKGMLSEAQVDEILGIQGKVVRSQPSVHDN